jgi:hypothetical protein
LSLRGDIGLEFLNNVGTFKILGILRHFALWNGREPLGPKEECYSLNVKYPYSSCVEHAPNWRHYFGNFRR